MGDGVLEPPDRLTEGHRGKNLQLQLSAYIAQVSLALNGGARAAAPERKNRY